MFLRIVCRIWGHEEPFADRVIQGQFVFVCRRCGTILSP